MWYLHCGSPVPIFVQENPVDPVVAHRRIADLSLLFRDAMPRQVPVRFSKPQEISHRMLAHEESSRIVRITGLVALEKHFICEIKTLYVEASA